MEDAITEIAPPSRFFEENLNKFTQPSPALPSPFLLFSQPQPQPLQLFLLITARSSPSLSLFHHFPSKTLIASLILPEIPFSSVSLQLSVYEKTYNIHSLAGAGDALLVDAQFPVAANRFHSIVKLLVGDRILPKSVLVLDSVRSQNNRRWLSPDEAFAFKLETSAERKRVDREKLLEGLEYYPSGSVVDGLGVVILGR